MKRKLVFSTILMLIVSLSFAGLALATDGEPGTEAGDPAHKRRERSRGEVISVDPRGGAFTLQTLRGEELALIVDESTQFRGAVASLDELQVGMKVGVGAESREDGSLVALVVVVPVRPNLERYAGEVAAVDLRAGSFTLQTPRGEALTFLVDQDTRYRGAVTGLDELQAGIEAAVAALAQEDGSLLAMAVLVPIRQDLERYRGEIAAVSPQENTFTLQTMRGEEVTFQVDETTQFRGGVGSFEDLQVGMKAAVAASQTNGSLAAEVVLVPSRQFLTRFAGEVTAVDVEGGKFTVQTFRGEAVTFQVDDGTRFQSPAGEVDGLEDLQVGMLAAVAAEDLGENQYLAKAVIARPPRSR